MLYQDYKYNMSGHINMKISNRLRIYTRESEIFKIHGNDETIQAKKLL